VDADEPRELSSLLAAGHPLEADYAISIILGCCAAGTELGDLRWWSETLRLDWSPLPAHIRISRTHEVRMRPHDASSPRSFGYLSPERVGGQPWDERGWVFALGAILWEMLAGRRLFEGPTDYQTVENVRAARGPPLRDAPPPLDAIVRKALAQDPAGRYQTLGELAGALAAYRAASSPAPEPGSPYRT
jgi:serine/threonine protein kinase